MPGDMVPPRCPICREPMRNMPNIDGTRRGQWRSHTWWCPDDGTVLRPQHGGLQRMVLTADGELVPYAATTGAR